MLFTELEIRTIKKVRSFLIESVSFKNPVFLELIDKVARAKFSYNKDEGLLGRDSGDEYVIIVSWYCSPNERLVTFVHELIHLLFIQFPSFRSSSRMNEFAGANEEFELVIDELSYYVVDKHYPEVADVFEKCFGFKHTDWTLND